MPLLEYMPSCDPNVPGAGRPLQVGDIVRHRAGEVSARAIVIAVRPIVSTGAGARVTVTAEGPYDPYHFRDSAEDTWAENDWVLLHRPTTEELATPRVAPTLRRGDFVRHYTDPDSATPGQLVGEPEAGLVAVSGGAFTRLLRWPTNKLVFVRHPNFTELPPAPTEAGMARQHVDLEMAAAAGEWLVGQPISSRPSALRSLSEFCAGPGRAETFRSDYRRGGDASVANPVGFAITRLFNTLDDSLARCHACAGAGIAAEAGKPGCPHFYCGVCGREDAAEHCTICEGLQAVGATVCARCCYHVVCTEPGFEETMLRKDQCPQCERGRKGCKCPGCEVVGCMVKPVKACCAGCDGHCHCATECMRHTGMKQLFKFTAPADEKGMTRLLGTEIETFASAINKYTPLLRKAVAQWKASVITDGSIGGKGMELVTQPAGGAQWRQMIADLGAGFVESQSITRETCGLHMHVDCTDVDGYALKRIIQLYAHLEFCLYDALPLSRQTGSYSKPNGQALLTWLDNDAAKFDTKMAKGEAKRRLSYIQYGLVKPGVKIPRVGVPTTDAWGHATVATQSTIDTLTSRWDEIVESKTRNKSDPNRYSGLNMHSYWLRGTLEFRHHHGTNDPEKITNWGFVCGSLVDYCVTHSDEDMPMILALKPRLAMEMVLDGQPDVMAWLQTRWDLFTTAHKTRLNVAPERHAKTGEV